jgi:hypothetical protein
MRTVRIAAVVLAILGGIYALLGYATVVRAGGGAYGYVWFLFASVVVIVGGGVAVLSRPQDGSMGQRACLRCGTQAEEDWTLCPTCGARLPHSIDEVAPRDRGSERAEEGRAAEDHEPDIMGKALFWLGIVVLDVLFVLFVLWLFAPSLALSQKIFSSIGGTLAIVLLDVGLVSILVGYSRTSSAIRI